VRRQPAEHVSLDFERRATNVLLEIERRHSGGLPMTEQNQAEALRGSIDLLVLKTLSLTAMHGWGIGQRIQQISGGELEVNQGSLYPALQRLEQRGLIRSDWGTTENNRRARYYEITAAGRKALGDETESWRRFTAAVDVVLRST
jgi:PadR family transcriptional regulator, regulatory protein PadR